ncbi:MAG: APC family permease [Caldilineaceae bacterium]
MSKPVQAGATMAVDGRTKVIVATSVMLTFISFWRAAAIVLNDLGSSAFYVGGIAEQAVGRAAPWFILGVMLFSYAVRAVYVESCAMFTRGGVYRVVKEAMGGTLAKLSVSALMFDYILTGPISGVSAGQYIVGLIAQTVTYAGYPWSPSKGTINLLSAFIAVLITGYFWWRNTKGIHESSDDALKIMYATTAMVVLMILWSGITILTQPDKQRLPPAPVPQNLTYNHDAVGWMPALAPGKFYILPKDNTAAANNPDATETHWGIVPNAGMLFGLIGLLIAFGHSFLAMSGEESLAQVNRELEYPKHKNLMRAGMVIFVYSLLFTSLVSFFAYAIIPDNVRAHYYDNLISGIAMNVVGPLPLKLIFQAFIVIVGFLMLAGAVNTAIIGSNGVLNRLSEDGVLTDWFRAPHHKYGTTFRMINLIVILQLLTIIGSRGNVYTLGEAYAFGVVWSFAFKGLAMLVLRFKDKSHREWKVPLNFNLGGNELPIGLGLIATLLFLIAGINLVTKQVATVSGLAFTLIFFVVFFVSEQINERKRGGKAHEEMDHFRLHPQADISPSSVGIRPGNTICLVRDYNTLSHVKTALELTHTGKRDLVMMTIRVLQGPDSGYANIHQEQLFTTYEQKLFSKVVALAEKVGKHVNLLVVPSTDIFQAIARAAAQLKSSNIVAGASSVMTPAEQALMLGQAWERLPEKPKNPVRFRIVTSETQMDDFYLGAHAPDLTTSDIERIHRLWLALISVPGNESLHHRDVVDMAIQRLEEEVDRLEGEELGQLLAHQPPHNHPVNGSTPVEPPQIRYRWQIT